MAAYHKKNAHPYTQNITGSTVTALALSISLISRAIMKENIERARKVKWHTTDAPCAQMLYSLLCAQSVCLLALIFFLLALWFSFGTEWAESAMAIASLNVIGYMLPEKFKHLLKYLKTELITIGPKQQRTKFKAVSLCFMCQKSWCLDFRIYFDQHVKSITRTVFVHLRS